MQIISPANETVLAILKRFKTTTEQQRMICYCVETPVDDGVLLFNLLTRELVLLTAEEYANPESIPELKDRWFLVPEDAKEKEYADLVKWVLSNCQKKSKNITGYTIFPTTDCNARCFYCFELGRSRIPMSEETALKTVQYIKDHCGGEKIHISWFGGEPLFNQAAIHTICDGLRREGVEFKSTMVSNGYLFDAQTVKTAVENWNLHRVQITLDGTEKVYNKAKAFIYKEGSAYQRVLANIGLLLDAGVSIQIRLNMDLYNAENLLELVQELSDRFYGKKGLRIYAHHIFDGDKPMAGMHTDEEWEKRDAAMQRLQEKIADCGLAGKSGISKHLRMNHCMADSGRSVTILPDGNIGLCEHFSETEFTGHLDQETLDSAMLASWKETMPQIPECDTCFYYPECIKLKKCASGSVCFRQLRQDQLRKTKQQMENEYTKWLSQSSVEEEDEPADC